MLGHTMVAAISTLRYQTQNVANLEMSAPPNGRTPPKNWTPLLWASLTLDSSFCRMIGLQEWSYLVIFHHEPSFRGRKQVGKNRCLGMLPTFTIPVTALIHTFQRKYRIRRINLHTRGKIRICPYSLPTTKYEARKVENLYNAIKDSKVISLNQTCVEMLLSSIVCFYLNQRTYHLILLCQ